MWGRICPRPPARNRDKSLRSLRLASFGGPWFVVGKTGEVNIPAPGVWLETPTPRGLTDLLLHSSTEAWNK